MREVGVAIGRVETVATAIAAAVEEQAAATREITNSVQLVTATTSSSAEAMRKVLAIAETTDTSSAAALKAADEVGQTAKQPMGWQVPNSGLSTSVSSPSRHVAAPTVAAKATHQDVAVGLPHGNVNIPILFQPHMS